MIFFIDLHWLLSNAARVWAWLSDHPDAAMVVTALAACIALVLTVSGD